MNTRPCTIVIVGVESPLLDRETPELPQGALHRYWDSLWGLTGQYRIEVVLEQTRVDASATAVQLVEGGHKWVRVPAPIEPWDREMEEHMLEQILGHLPRCEGDTALVVCRSQHVRRLAERLSAHARQVKTVATPDLGL